MELYNAKLEGGVAVFLLRVGNSNVMDEANCAKWCLILLFGRPRHFASEIGSDVTYFDPFRVFKRSQFGS